MPGYDSDWTKNGHGGMTPRSFGISIRKN